MSSPNLKGAGKARPSFGKPATPATARTDSKAAVAAANKTRNRDGLPILFAANENIPGAVPVSQWLRELHPQLRKLYPRVADQVPTRRREAPQEPPEPEPIRPLSPNADPQRTAEYNLALAIYLDERRGRREAIPRIKKDLEAYVDQERQAMAFVWGMVSPTLQHRIEEQFEDFATSNDLVKLISLAETFAQSQRNQNERGLRLAAEKSMYNIVMTANESLLSYQRRFMDAAQLVVDRGGRDVSPPSYARMFLQGLDRRWSQMLSEMANKEAEVEVKGIGEDPYPQDLSTACALAAARVSMKSPVKFEEESKISTINKAVGRGADSEGRGGGNRKGVEKTTHAKKAERPKGAKGECHTCQGELNEVAGGTHFSKECPVTMMDEIEKTKLFNKLKSNAKPKGGGGTVKSSVRYENDDDSEDSGYATIMGTARPIIVKSARKRFKGSEFQLDNGANVKVIVNGNLLTNIRPNPRSNIDVIDTANGQVSFKQIGDNSILGTCYYDPNGEVNILPYSDMCRSFEVQGHRPDPKEPELFHDINFGNGVTVRFHLTSDNIYIGDMRQAFRGTVKATVITKMSEKQRRDAESVRSNIHLTGFESLAKLYVSMKRGYLTHVPYTVEDVRRAMSLKPIDSIAEVAVRQGKRTNRPVHGLKLGNFLREREIVLHGDILFILKVPFLLLVSEPGSYAAVKHLVKRNTSSIFKELKDIVAWFTSFKWTTTIISFDGEGAISKASAEIRGLGIEVVVYPRDTCDPIAEAKIRRIKDRARSMLSYVRMKHGWEINIRLVAWLGVTAAARTNLSPTSSNPDECPPITFITELLLDYRRYCAASFGDYVEVFSESSNSMAPRTQPAIALMCDLRGNWWVLLLTSLKVVKRNIIATDVMTTTAAVRLRMEELREQYPLSDGITDAITDIDSNDSLEDVETLGESLEHTVRSEDSGVEDVTDDIDNAVEPVATVEPVAAVEPVAVANVDDAELIDDIGDVELVIDQLPAMVPPAEPPPKKENWHRRVITRGLGKVTRSGKIYSAYSVSKKNVLFSVAGVLSLKKGLEQYGEEARKALVAEIDQMLKRKVWTGVLKDTLSKRQRKAIIRSHTFLKEKLSPTNVFLKLKARLVAMGNLQDRSLYGEEETSSPTVAQSSAYVVLAVAANERRHVMSFDVTCAYLNADMPGEVIMELDPITTAILTKLDSTFETFVDEHGKVLVKLNKALYGCVESARLWYEHFKRALEKLGYTMNEYDPCVFNRWTESGLQSTVFFHVDDGIATCEEEAELDKLERELRNEFGGELNVTRGKRHEFLGLLLDFSQDGVVIIKAPRLIGEILKDFEVSGTSRVPAGVGLFEIDEDSPLLSEAQRRKFHGGVQKLLYIASKCRLDISVAVSFLTTRVTIATEQDLKKLVKTLRYLNGTTDVGLKLGGDEQGFISVQIFADAAYGVHSDAKSHWGVAVTLGRGVVLGHSGKQRLVTKSSAEAELVAQSDSLGYGFRILNFAKAQGYCIEQGIIHQDNQAAIRLAETGRSTSSRTRHIKIRYFFLKQFLDSQELQVVYCPTDKMIADVLTKPLQGECFAKGRDFILGYASP